MHIFLTGEKQIGKTTAINAFLTSSGVSADGFLTTWEPHSSSRQGLYICSLDMREKYLLAVKGISGAEPIDNIIEIFDVHGAGILEHSGKCECIIMDELGIMEERAEKFRAAVMRRLDGDVPIIGVVAKKPSPFLDKIRNHPTVRLIEVTVENRDSIVSFVHKLFNRA